MGKFNKGSDVNVKYSMIVGFGIVALALMMIVPLPPFVLDTLLGVNMCLSVMILIMTLSIKNVLEFSSFPTLLLITTLFRTGLNVSSTRLILTEGYAGNVVEAFGTYVIRGDYVAGLIMFIIIVLIQFMVITKGSSRIAEVSARFSLDSLGGKQMSIESDLSSGDISNAEARKQRTELQEYIDFCGSMDGASNFVKNDAMVGIAIAFINILGGTLIGMMRMGMSFSEAGETFISLTVGDGLVSQIPSLLISIALGVLITKTGTKEDITTQLFKQFTASPKAIAMTGGVAFVLALIPGMPKLVFIVLGVGLIGIAYALNMANREEASKVLSEEESVLEEAKTTIEDISELTKIDMLELELGSMLLKFVQAGDNSELIQRITTIRRQCAITMGIVVQPIWVRDNLQLKSTEYTIKIKGNVVARYEVMPDMLMCLNPDGGDLDIRGIPCNEPTFGLEAKWIKPSEQEEAELNGYTVVDVPTVIATHLLDVLQSRASDLIGREEVKLLIDAVRESYPTVVDELVPELLTLGEVQKVFQALLDEKIAIKDKVTILECLADNSKVTRDIETLTELVRISLRDSICANMLSEGNYLDICVLSDGLSAFMEQSVMSTSKGTYLQIEPNKMQTVLAQIDSLKNSSVFKSGKVLILVSPKIRASFRRLIDFKYPNIVVLSINEIPNNVLLRQVGVIE